MSAVRQCRWWKPQHHPAQFHGRLSGTSFQKQISCMFASACCVYRIQRAGCELQCPLPHVCGYLRVARRSRFRHAPFLCVTQGRPCKSCLALLLMPCHTRAFQRDLLCAYHYSIPGMSTGESAEDSSRPLAVILTCTKGAACAHLARPSSPATAPPLESRTHHRRIETLGQGAPQGGAAASPRARSGRPCRRPSPAQTSTFRFEPRRTPRAEACLLQDSRPVSAERCNPNTAKCVTC